jgi:hypothetical protein
VRKSESPETRGASGALKSKLLAKTERMAFNASLLFYPHSSTRASDFRNFGGLLMGAIFPMAPLSSLGAVDGGGDHDR